MRRRIGVVTATRAEYGLLSPLIDEIIADPILELQLFVTGSHMAPEFGNTVDQIEGAGHPIAKRIEMDIGDDSPLGVCRSMGLAMAGFGEAFAELHPDIVVVLGDRYELIPIVTAASIARIPVAHLNGGELTEGANDELFRHAVTKMSHLHFTSTDEHRRRVIRMGEHPSRVFNVGEVGLDALERIKLMDREEFERLIGAELRSQNLIITFHPATSDPPEESVAHFEVLLKVAAELPDTLLILTKANADVGGRAINERIDAFVAEHPGRAVAFMSLGRRGYLSALQFVDAVVGNSSSGIVEAPSFKVGTVNIGDRQKGRVRATSVIDVDPTVEAIRDGLRTLGSVEFRETLADVANPYRKSGSSTRVREVLRDFDLDDLRVKPFFDGDER